MGQVVLIASGKGGVGKTTFTTNLAVAFAKRGYKSVVVDFNIGLRNSDLFLGLENRMLFDLGDVISGTCSLDKAVVECDVCSGVYLLTCPQQREISGLSQGHIDALFKSLAKSYDFVLIDCPVVCGYSLKVVSMCSDKALLITTPDYSSIRNCQAVNNMLSDIGMENVYYAINQAVAIQDQGVPSLDFVAKNISAKPIGIVPYDIDIHICNNKGYPIALKNESYAAKSFADIAARLV